MSDITYIASIGLNSNEIFMLCVRISNTNKIKSYWPYLNSINGVMRIDLKNGFILNQV